MSSAILALLDCHSRQDRVAETPGGLLALTLSGEGVLCSAPLLFPVRIYFC